MVEKHPKDGRKPQVVYDVKMPAYVYRDERGKSVTLDVVRPKQSEFKLDCLSNLPVGG